MQNVFVNRCTRFSVDGIACQNDTAYRDRWCREARCSGFTRPSSASAPTLKDVKFYGSPEEIAETGPNPADIRCSADTVKVWPQAIRNFKFHHGGTDEEAEVQIRWMLADFLDRSARTVTGANYLVLSRDGYRLHVDPTRKRITGYSTTHRERTWEQVKTGIPSRIGPMKADPVPIVPNVQCQEPGPPAPRKPTPIMMPPVKPPTARPGHRVALDPASQTLADSQDQSASHTHSECEPTRTADVVGAEQSAPPGVGDEARIAQTKSREQNSSDEEARQHREEPIAERCTESESAPPVLQSDQDTRLRATVTHDEDHEHKGNKRLIALAVSTVAAIWLTRTKRTRRP